MNTSTSSKRKQGSILLNILAVALTLMPVLTVSVWTYQQFFSDTRRVVALSEVRSDSIPHLFDEPIISVTFDDGWESAYSVAAPLMSEYNVVSTQYVLPGEFNSPNYISAAQAHSLKKAGHEITSHTLTHPNLTQISADEMRKELDESLRVLREENLIDENTRSFAAPNGAVNDTVMREVKMRYGSSRNVMGDLAKDVSDNDMNVRGKFDRYDIIGYTVGQYTTDDQLERAFTYAKVHNAWFVPIYHQIDDSGDKYSVSKETFERHIKLYKRSGIKLSTVGEVLQNYKEKR